MTEKPFRLAFLALVLAIGPAGLRYAGVRPKRSLTVAIIGQSNEVGAGQLADPNVGSALQRDPVPPFGGMRSMWPTLEDIAAQRKVRIWVWNSAVGATSIVHSWAGTLRDWQSGLTLVPGDYVRLQNRIYKNITPNPKQNLNRTTSPPIAGTSLDGIRWQNMGPARADELPGKVFRMGERLFDPNGYIKIALHGLEKHPGEPWVFISFGQGDGGTFWDVSRGQYTAGLIAVTDAALAAGAHVAIGFSSGTAKPELEKAYQQKLIPGWRDALAHYAGDARVIEGANLRIALGSLSITTDGSPGVQPDRLHMNDAAYLLASQAWADALARASVLPR
jgi:hypothetical protein